MASPDGGVVRAQAHSSAESAFRAADAQASASCDDPTLLDSSDESAEHAVVVLAATAVYYSTVCTTQALLPFTEASRVIQGPACQGQKR